MAASFLSVVDFADAYGVSPETVWRMLRRGDLIKSQPGGKNHAVRIPREELERLRTGERPDCRAPDLRADGADDIVNTQQKNRLPGPKPKWRG